MEDASIYVPPLDIALAYNLRTEESEEQAERLQQDYVDDVAATLADLGHQVTPVEVTGTPHEIFGRLKKAAPDLVFNLAEGEGGAWREAFYPMLYEFLGLPYTGAGPGILGLGLDKRLTEEVLAERGVHVPRGRLVTPDGPRSDGLRYPLIIKPNYEGSAMGIHQDSVVEDEREAKARIEAMLEEYPEGLDVEEFIRGRELTVGFLAEAPESLTPIVEYRMSGGEHNILDYETRKQGPAAIETVCPARLTPTEEAAVRQTAARAFGAMRVPDVGRVDLRLREDGQPFLIEINPLPGLRAQSPLIVGAKKGGLSYEEVIGLIVQSAARRHRLVHDSVEDLVDPGPVV